MRRTERHRQKSATARVLWTCVLGVVVCILVGSVLGAAAFATLAVTRGGGSYDVLRAYPVLVLYTLPVTVPIGCAAGVAAGLIMGKLGTGSYREASLAKWLRTGAALGAGLGFVSPWLLLFIGFGGLSVVDWLFYMATGAASGCAAGRILAAIGWREFGWRRPAAGPEAK